MESQSIRIGVVDSSGLLKDTFYPNAKIVDSKEFVVADKDLDDQYVRVHITFEAHPGEKDDDFVSQSTSILLTREHYEREKPTPNLSDDEIKEAAQIYIDYHFPISEWASEVREKVRSAYLAGVSLRGV